MNNLTAPPVSADGRKTRNLLSGILILGFLLRVVIVFFVPLIHMHRDSYDYYRQADIILQGRYLNYFPNGYPFIVAIARTLSENHSQLLLLWLNIGMSTLSVYFVYDIGKRLFDKVRVALLAAFLMAIFPPLLNYVRWIMSETPTIFFLVGAYFFYYRRQNWWSGLFFGLATIVRTNIAPVFALLLVLELIWQRRVNYRLLITALIPILMTGYYCYWQTGKFSIEGNARINIMYSVTASGNNIDFRIGDKYPEIDTEDKAMKWYMDHMKKEPAEYTRQRLANFWELWGFYASDAQGFRSPMTRLLLGACNFFLVVFGLIGWWMLRRQFMAFILILPFVVATAVGTFLVAIPRYAYPAHPFMILLGCWTILYWLTREKTSTAPVA
jgi:hypothetical protein